MTPPGCRLTLIAADANGTFTGTKAGKRAEQDSVLLLSFDNGPAKYGGTVVGNAGVGAMSTFIGIDGCRYLIRLGAAAGLGSCNASEARQFHDAAGLPG